MTIEQWLEWAIADTERRDLRHLKPLLEALAHSLRALRGADFNDRADGRDNRHPHH